MIVSLTLLGQMLELRARSQTSAAIKALLGLAPKTARRLRDDGSEEDVPLDARPRRRPPARASRREGAGRRRGARRPLQRRRIDAHRRADAGRARPSGDTVIGATINGTGSLVMRAEKVGARHACWRRSCRWSRRRSARARRCSAWPTRSRSGSCSRCWRVAVATFLAWGLFGPEPSWTYARAQRGVGADHRLPVRAGPGHADVDHGRHRPRRAAPACCSAMPRRSRHLRAIDTLIVDKTGTLTEGRPAFRAVHRRRTASRRAKCCGWRPASTRAASIRWPRRSSPRRARASWRSRRRTDFESATGIGVRGRGRGRATGARQHGADAAKPASTLTPLVDAGRALRAGGRERRCSSRSTAGSPG